MEKQRLLYQQSRLHNRGAAEMVLQMISACKGILYPYLWSTLFTRIVFMASCFLQVKRAQWCLQPSSWVFLSLTVGTVRFSGYAFII